MVQDQLRGIGIDLQVNAGDQATQNADSKDITKVQLYHSMVGRADYDVITSFYGIDNRDAFLNQDAEGNPIDAHLQELLDAVLDTPDTDGRIEATEKVQDYITEQAYALPLFEEPVVYAVRPEVSGFSPESVARPWFYEVSIDAAPQRAAAREEKE